MIDKWTVIGIDAIPILEGLPLNYQHDLTDSVDFAGGDYITEAWLELDFRNDLVPSDTYQLTGMFRYDNREFARIAFDGAGWIDVTDPAVADVDVGRYSFLLDVGWLNDDGRLDVMIDVYNFVGGLLSTAQISLDDARLYGIAATVSTPVPGAVLLGALGLGFAGRKLRRMC